MELAGDEKRIQALFSELMLDDQTVVPEFEMLWHARPRTPASWQPLSWSLVLVATVLVLTVFGSLALWSLNKSGQPKDQPAAKITAPGPSTPSTTNSGAPRGNAQAVSTKPARRGQRFKARLKPALLPSEWSVNEAVAISNWQSPTTIFLESPANQFLKSMPQLNQSERELQSFLAGNMEEERER